MKTAVTHTTMETRGKIENSNSGLLFPLPSFKKKLFFQLPNIARVTVGIWGVSSV